MYLKDGAPSNATAPISILGHRPIADHNLRVPFGSLAKYAADEIYQAAVQDVMVTSSTKSLSYVIQKQGKEALDPR